MRELDKGTLASEATSLQAYIDASLTALIENATKHIKTEMHAQYFRREDAEAGALLCKSFAKFELDGTPIHEGELTDWQIGRYYRSLW